MTSSMTIVVTCADRKSLPVAPGLRFREVPSGTAEERAQDWRARLGSTSEARQLVTLYQGDQWRQSLKLLAVAEDAGFTPRLLVASAGLGLRSAHSAGPAYAATFARNSMDAVARSLDEAVAWWTQIGRSSADMDLSKLDDRVLLVLSRSYALPLTHDLAALGTSNPQCALVGGASDFHGLLRIPSDATLRRALQGTLSSLNQRMAIRFLELSHGPGGWLSEDHLHRWRTWAGASGHRERFSRKRGSDQEIKDWIERTARRSELSATTALSMFRSQGMACEQGRFSRLHREVVTAL